MVHSFEQACIDKLCYTQIMKRFIIIITDTIIANQPDFEHLLFSYLLWWKIPLSAQVGPRHQTVSFQRQALEERRSLWVLMDEKLSNADFVKSNFIGNQTWKNRFDLFMEPSNVRFVTLDSLHKMNLQIKSVY